MQWDWIKKGGNAVDAAVAIGFALAVTLPQAGNLGGGGFMLSYDARAGQTEAIDFREIAPAAAGRDQYLSDAAQVDEQRIRFSHQAAGVPGTVAGLALAHQRHGRLAWRQLLEPARQLAAQGRPSMVTGSPGGSRIITTVLQILLNVIDHGLNIAEATIAPRMHHQWLPDELQIEEGFSPDTLRLLSDWGHKVVVKNAMGDTQSIARAPEGWYGFSDTRRVGGSAAGY